MSKSFVLNLGTGITVVDMNYSPVSDEETEIAAVLNGFFASAGNDAIGPFLVLNTEPLIEYFESVTGKTVSEFVMSETRDKITIHANYSSGGGGGE